MRLIFTFILITLLSITTKAQNQLSGSITTIESKPIEYASVTLFALEDSTYVDGILTNKKGYFTFLNLKKGYYQLTIQMLGYEDWIKTINVIGDTSLKSISLKKQIETLNEVTVTAYQSVIENQLGKKVLRIGKDLTLTGSNVLEALDNIPSVATTPKGEIQIRGNSNVIIYINGKPTKRNPASLKFIAAESLEKIEIITNPSAKYDAEGVGGIINLVYKKDSSNVFKLELISNVTITTNPVSLNPSGGMNISFVKKNISFFTNLSSKYGKYENYIASKRSHFEDSLWRYENLLMYRDLGIVNSALTGFSIELDSTASIGLEVNFDRWDLKNDIEQRNIFDYRIGVDKEVLLPSKREELEHEVWINLTFEKKVAKKQFLKISLTGGGENETNFSESEDIKLNSLTADIQQFLRSSSETERQRYYQGELEYEVPFFNLGNIEMGVKADFVEYDICQEVNLYSDTLQLPKNDFDMDMQKLGIFITQKNKFKRLEYGLGLRLEQFSSKAFQESDQSTFTQDYIRLFPSIQLNYLLDKQRNNTLGINYTKRIKRPGFFNLNPYVTYEDPLNIETGNPALQPEIADLIELNYHQEWEQINMDLTIYSRNTKDAIQPIVRSIDNNRSLTTTTNIKKSRSTGLEFQLEYRPFKKFKTLNNFTWVQYQFEDAENEISYNRQRVWNVQLKQIWNFKKNWKVELSEMYRAPFYQIQQKTNAIYYINFGLSKKFNNKKGSFSFVVRDVFNTRQYINSFRTTELEIERSYKWQTRQIVIGYRYNFLKREKD